MVKIGKMAGKHIMALVTDMNQPLGNAVGNALEVKEAIEILQGGHCGDLKNVSMELAAHLLVASGLDDESGARQMVAKVLSSGEALDQFAQMIEAQGGDPGVCQDTRFLPEAGRLLPITAPAEGYIHEVMTDEIGTAALLLGAGRTKKSDTIDPSVGIWMKKRQGDYVMQGEEIAVFHINDAKNLAQAKLRFQNSLTFAPEVPKKNPLIYNTIS